MTTTIKSPKKLTEVALPVMIGDRAAYQRFLDFSPKVPPLPGDELWSTSTSIAGSNMTHLSVHIPDQAATVLAGLARSQGQTPEQLVAALVEQYLEDAEDLADALEALADGEAPIPLEQVKRELEF